MRVLRPESRPKTYEGAGVQGAPATTLRATFGTQSTESHAADAGPARDIAAVINPQATADAAMIVLMCASLSGRRELDVQFGESAQDERRLVCVIARIDRPVLLLADPDVGQPVEQSLDRDAALDARQRRTGT